METNFHLALPCINIVKTRSFYTDVLGAKVGRSDIKWADINLYNHQLTFTECGNFKFDCNSYNFNGNILPSFHFGVILKKKEWHEMLSSLKDKEVSMSEIRFLVDKRGEHQSFFVKDPNDYTVEFKCFKVADEIFQS